MKLRDYQLDAVRAVQVFLEYREGHPVCVLPCGAGKSIVIAAICEWLHQFNLRVLMLSHVAELLEQNAEKLKILSPQIDVGVYSAGLGLRQFGREVTVAGVQSVFRRASELGEIDAVIVDEAHAISDDDDTMYGQLIREMLEVNPKLKIIGLTATPFRSGSGSLVGPDRLFSAICHAVPLKQLVDDGWLSPLRSKRVSRCDTGGLRIVAGEFNQQQVAELVAPATPQAVAEVLIRTVESKTVLVFAANVAHAEAVQEMIPGSELITGETDADVRADILRRAKSGELKYVVNVRCLTTGVDVPSIDAIAVLFPTQSPGLWMQIVGRGMRLSPGKTHCTILDFGSNIERFGSIYNIQPPEAKGKKAGIAPVKFCPDCKEAVAMSVRTCPDCGFQFPAHEVKTESAASNADIIGDDEADELPVYEVRYRKHFKKGGTPDDPATLRVEYVTKRGMVSSWMRNAIVCEWVCLEHHGFAHNKAALWWKLRSNDPMPETVDRAIDMAEGGGLAVPSKIWVVPEGKYTRISRVELGPKPEPAALCGFCGGTGCDECKFEFSDVTPPESVFSIEEVPF